MLQASLDIPTCDFCLEQAFPDYFLLEWCKKAPPSPSFVRNYARFVATYRIVPRDPLPDPDWPQLEPLFRTADALGSVLLYRHQGFLSNPR